MALNITLIKLSLERLSCVSERGVAVVRVLVARGEHNIAIVVDDNLF